MYRVKSTAPVLRGRAKIRSLAVVGMCVCALNGCGIVALSADDKGKAAKWSREVSSYVHANYDLCPDATMVVDRRSNNAGWTLWGYFEVHEEQSAAAIVNSCFEVQPKYLPGRWSHPDGWQFGPADYGIGREESGTESLHVFQDIKPDSLDLSRVVQITRRSGVPYRVDFWMLTSVR